MDAFNYLSVLLSIILGLGITQVLTAGGRLVRGRAMVRPDWIPLVWAGILLVMYVQVWWAMFGLRARTAWDFVSFLVVLLQTVALYLTAALVLPESVPEPPPGDAAAAAAPLELRAHYERHAPWFFGFLGLTVLMSVIKELVLEGRLPEPANLAFHLFLLLACGLGMVVRQRRVHEMLALVNGAAVALYIGALFSRLR